MEVVVLATDPPILGQVDGGKRRAPWFERSKDRQIQPQPPISLGNAANGLGN